MHMKATAIVTNTDHPHYVGEIFHCERMPGVDTFLKVSDTYYDGFLGFGLALTSASCYELNQLDPDVRKELLKHIYGKDGIGLNVGRICVGASDYSPEIYTYDDHPFDTSLEHFSIERDEKYVIPMIKEIIEINPDIYLFSSPWSPPGWMKTGGSIFGGYMREEFIDCYADYYVKFIKAYAEHGIKISAVTPQNEPNTQQWEKMPACIWHPEIEAKFIKILKKKFVENGLDIKIWMFDHNYDNIQRVIWSLENCEGLKDSCEGVAFHYYKGYPEKSAEVTKRFPNLELHFTEGGPRVHDHYDTDWCKWGLIAIKMLKLGYKSFTGWNLMLNEMGCPNIGPYHAACAGFVSRDTRTGELSYSGQYKAYSHIAPYINEKSKIHPIYADISVNVHTGDYPVHDREIEGVLIENDDGKKIAILVNINDHRIQTQLEVDGKLWLFEMLEDSLYTIIFE